MCVCVCICHSFRVFVCEHLVDSEGEKGGLNDDFYGNENHIQRLLQKDRV